MTILKASLITFAVRTSTAIASKHSPSPTRRASQPSLQTSSPEPSTRTQNVRMRRISNTSSGPRPTSYYDGGANSPPGSSNAAAGSPTRYSRASSVQPRSAAELDYRNGGDVSPPTSDLAHHRAHSLNRSTTNLNRPDFTPLTPVSRIQVRHNLSLDVRFAIMAFESSDWWKCGTRTTPGSTSGPPNPSQT